MTAGGVVTTAPGAFETALAHPTSRSVNAAQTHLDFVFNGHPSPGDDRRR